MLVFGAMRGFGPNRGARNARLVRFALLTVVAWIVALGAAGTASAQATPPKTSPFAVAFNNRAGTSQPGAVMASANPGANTVSLFEVAETGRMREVHGSPVPSGGLNPQAVAFTNNGVLAVANAGSNNVTVFKVDFAVSGIGEEAQGLKEVAHVSTAGEPTSLAVGPSTAPGEALLAVASAPNTVELFSVNSNTGAVTRLGSPHRLANDADPSSVSFSLCGDLLATANTGNDTMSVFSVDRTTGTLTDVPDSPVHLPANSHPHSVSFGPALNFCSPGPPATYQLALVAYDVPGVYIFTAAGGGVSEQDFTPTPTTHSAVEFSGPFFTGFPGLGGLFVATANRDHSVSVFSVAADGSLTEVARKPTGSGPTLLGANGFGTAHGLIATANYDDGTVSVFRTDVNGALGEAPGSPFALRNSPVHAFLTRVGPRVDVGFCFPGPPVFPAFDSTLFAVTVECGSGGGDGVYVSKFEPDGEFTAPAKQPVGPRPLSSAFSPTGTLLVVANRGDDSTPGDLAVFSVDHATGALSHERRVDVGPFDNGVKAHCTTSGAVGLPFCWTPESVAVDPDGQYVALLSGSGDGSGHVSMYKLGSGGQLTHVDDFPLPDDQAGANNVTFNSTGTLLALADIFSGKVTILKVLTDGNLEQAPGSPHPSGVNTRGGAGPQWVAFSPDGRLLALVSEQPFAPVSQFNESLVFLYSVTQEGPNKGALDDLGTFPTSCGPEGVAFGPEEGSLGGLLGTANYDCANISLFFVGAGQRHVAAAADAGVVQPRQDLNVLRASQDPFLTEVVGSPVTGAPIEPFRLAFSPNGQFLATSDTSEFEGFSAWGPTGRVEIDKSATPSKVAPGGVLHYTLRVHNPNAYPVIATVTDDLGDILDEAAYRHDAHATIGTVAVDTATRVLTWHGTLQKGETALIRYSFTVHAHASGTITNRVLGPFSAFCSEGPPELPCETQTPIEVPKGPGADLSVTKTPSTHSTHPGAQVLYTLVVHNHGPGDATGVTVQDSAPPSVFFQSARPSQGSPCTVTATDLTCRLGSIVSGGSALVLVEATVATSARGDQTNVAVVHGDQPDPNPDNNTGRSTITVTPWTEPERASNLVVAKHGPRTATQGQTFRYTITVTNKGPDSASDVTLIDAPRLPITVVSIHSSHGRCQTGTPIRCSLGTLHTGTHATITVTAIAHTAGRQVNSAVVMSPNWDPGPGSNLGEAETTIRPAPAPSPPPFTG